MIITFDKCSRWASSMVVWSVTCWTVVLLVVTIRAALYPHIHSVYPIFALAGQHWMDGADLYGMTDPKLDVFRYSPLVAAVAPLAIIPERFGNVAWRLLNVVVLLGASAWWGRAVLGIRRNAEHSDKYISLSADNLAALFLLVLPLQPPACTTARPIRW